VSALDDIVSLLDPTKGSSNVIEGAKLC
jgi:hypothetical protein